MKRTSSILSLVLVVSCASGPFPRANVYVADLKNRVCAKYQINDQRAVTMHLIEELPLEPKGPCDRMVGFSRYEFKDVQNWIRDQMGSER